MRLKYGLPSDRLLIAFVGALEPRKGPRRIAEAMRNVGGVAGVFVGSGTEPPEGDHVIFCRRLPHQQVPELLSACDVFALPTTDEGCCNALIEAMACGLPVISSTGPFNDDILNRSVSIRIDPMDVQAIREGILQFRDHPEFRAQMAAEALRWSANFDINQRASNILGFMAERIARGSHRACAPSGALLGQTLQARESHPPCIDWAP